MVAGKWRSRVSRISSAQRVRSALFFFGKRWHRKGIPAEGVGVAKICFHFSTNGTNPNQMQSAGDKCHIPERGIIKSKSKV